MQPFTRATVVVLLLFLCCYKTNSVLAQQCTADASFTDPIYSNFNFCTNTSSASSFKFTIENTSKTKATNTGYSINWGDKTPEEAIGSNFTTASHIYKEAGTYDITVTVTGANGCKSSKTERLFIGSNPGLGITSLGNNTDCSPVTYQFKISGVKGNSPQTEYTFQFDDGTPPIKFTHANFPKDSVISHTFSESSKSKPNGFTLSGTASNRCNTSFATFTGIRVSTGPVADIKASTSGCIGQVVKLQDASKSGYDATSKSDKHNRSWTISPATGWEIVSGGLESAAVDVKFNTAGVYKITIEASPIDPTSKCQSSSKEQTITIGELPEVSITSPKARICYGESTTLEATGTDTFTWKPADGLQTTTGSTVVVNPTRTTTYTVTGSSGSGCAATTTFTVEVDPLPAAPKIDNQTICYNSSRTISVKAPQGVHSWYTQKTGGLAFHTGNEYQTPDLKQNTTYYVETSIDGGCPSPRTAVTVTVLPETTAPSVEPVTLCGVGNSATLVATGNADAFNWYSSEDRSTLLFTGSDYKTRPLEVTTSFFVQASKDGCLSSLTEVKVTVLETYVNNISNNTVTPPTAAICAGQSPAELAGSIPTGGEYPFSFRWESSETGEASDYKIIPDATAASYKPGALTKTTWFRRVAISGPCAENISNAVKVEVVPAIGLNNIKSDQTICEGDTPETLTGEQVTGGSGAGSYSFLWESSTTGPDKGFTAAAGENTLPEYTAPAPLIKTTWYRRVVYSGPCQQNISAPVVITVQPAIVKNTITSGNQAICTGDVPVKMTAGLPSGGNGNYSYSWESSTTGRPADFTEAAGPHHLQDYTPSQALEQNTWFRRKVSSGNCESYSEPILVTVHPAIAQNIISKDETICTGAAPAELTGEAPAGGNGMFTYQWEISSTGKDGSFRAINNATNASFAPGTLVADTWYRRVVTSGACSNVSNVVQITVSPAIVNNTVGLPQSVYAGQAPSTLTGSVPGKGAGAGTYTYVWESSTTGRDSGFTTATGISDEQHYTPGALTQTTWFRRRVLSGGCESVSEAIMISVIAAISNNTIEASQVICYNNRPAPLKGTIPTGGDEDYIYLWQYSTKGPDRGFTTAPGTSHLQHYSPQALTQDTWFRRVAVSGPNPDTSAVVLISVKPALSNNRISTNQTVCYGTAPGKLTGTAPAGGSGTYYYLWEYSTEGADKGFITAPGANNQADYQPGVLREKTWFRRVVTSESCDNLASTPVVINITPVPDAPLVQGVTNICPGTSTTLFITTIDTKVNGNRKFEWYASATDSSPLFVGSAGAPFYTPNLTETTTYYVQEVALSCASERTPVTVHVTGITASAGPDMTTIKGRAVTLNGSGGETYSWSPAIGLSNPHVANPVATPEQTTTYTLTVTSATGCVYTDEVTITVKENIFIPNTFTPNRDGINDTWEIKSLAQYPNCKVEVFNQWGSLIFHSEGYGAPWDGRHNGKELPLATYYYIIHYDVNEKPLSGSVTIVK